MAGASLRFRERVSGGAPGRPGGTGRSLRLRAYFVHYAVASEVLANGLDVLLEKPIATTLTEADALLRQIADTGQILQIGLLERFNPAVAGHVYAQRADVF